MTKAVGAEVGEDSAVAEVEGTVEEMAGGGEAAGVIARPVQTVLYVMESIFLISKEISRTMSGGSYLM